MNRPLLSFCVVLAACSGGASDETTSEVGSTAISFLGGGDMARVQIEVIATKKDGLRTPTDIAFQTDVDDDAWVTTRADNGVVIIKNASSGDPKFVKHAGTQGSDHFLAKPAGLAFGKPGFWASCQDENQITQASTPWDFMGPSLWPSDQQEFEGGHATHYDMLHNSPSCVGIAWEDKNIYWIFDGEHNSLTRYNFKKDHGAAGADHSDGDIRRYVDGEMAYVEDVVSNMHYMYDSKELFVVDSGHNRVAVLLPETGMKAGPVPNNMDGGNQFYYDGASFQTFIDTAADGFKMPSGLTFYRDNFIVADAQTGLVAAYSLEGKLLVSLETGIKGLAGITVGPDGALWLVNQDQQEVLRMVAK